jgi:membrane peptidoglycan carboxypeptidase
MVKARALALFVVLAFLAGACDLPRLDDQRERPLAQTSSIYASDGSLITDLHATENRVVLTEDQIRRPVRDAAVAIEDRRFYDHGGIDVFALARALAVDIGHGRIVEGGSTITQQLVKNLYTGDAQNLRRKIDEAALALQMEHRYTKDEILTDYLNTVYFGEGAYGIEAAAETYFGIHASELDLSESATLAGLITAPNHFDPFVRPDSAHGRRDVVLRIMDQMDTITHAEHDQARREPITVVHSAAQDRYPFPYFVDYFKRWFCRTPRSARPTTTATGCCSPAVLRITTTLDPAIQADGENAVRQILRYPGDPDSRSPSSIRGRATCGRWSAARTRTTGRTSAQGASTSRPTPAGRAGRRGRRSRRSRSSPPSNTGTPPTRPSPPRPRSPCRCRAAACGT